MPGFVRARRPRSCERHGAQRAGPAGQPEGESRPGSDLKVKVLLKTLMTGTSSRTARAQPRGSVWRKLQANSRPEVHEAHTRRPHGGRGDDRTRSPMSSGPTDVDATGVWEESHAPYPLRSARLPARASEAIRPAHGVQKSAEAKVAASQRGKRAEQEVTNRSQSFDA